MILPSAFIGPIYRGPSRVAPRWRPTPRADNLEISSADFREPHQMVVARRNMRRLSNDPENPSRGPSTPSPSASPCGHHARARPASTLVVRPDADDWEEGLGQDLQRARLTAAR